MLVRSCVCSADILSYLPQLGKIEFAGTKLLVYRQKMRAGVSCGEGEIQPEGVYVCVCGDAVALGD